MNAIPLSGLDRLEPITLEEITDRAALQTRIDRKYLIPTASLRSLTAGLDPGTRVLHVDGRPSTEYHSVYFDTPDLACYRSSALRRRRRFKVRTRRYAETDLCFLEVKTRGGRGSTVKNRIGYRNGTTAQLTAQGLDYIGDRLVDAGVASTVPTLWPSLQTRYRRTTLLVPGLQDCRATIDLGLTWITPDGRATRVGSLAVVETKSGSSPSTVDRLLWSQGHRPVSLSKYGTGLALMHPDLPHHKWNRLICQRIRPALTTAAPDGTGRPGLLTGLPTGLPTRLPTDSELSIRSTP